MSDTHASPTPPAPAVPPPRPGAVLIGFLVLLVGELIILSQSGIGLPSILPKPISTYAENIDRLFYVILGLTGFFFLLTEGLLVYFLVRYRARPGEKAKHTHGNHALELAWTFIPGLILFCLAVFQTGTWGSVKYRAEFPKESDAEVIQVFGMQFEWHFRYHGPDGKFGTDDDVTSLAELHVPVNTPVIVKLRTKDVIHSFWLPNARLKQDLLPGKEIPQWFELTVPGTYEIACAELCGIGHTVMSGKLVVESREEYEAWLKQRAEQFGPPDLSDTNQPWHWWPEGPRSE